VAVGDEIVVRDGSTFWRAESGQGVLEFTPEELARKTLPFPPAPVPEQVEAEALYDRGCELEAGSPEEARHAYARVLDLDPTHTAARVNLGRLLHEAGHPLAAANHYRLALEGRPDDAIAAFNLGVALEDLGRDAEAIAAYELALAADPAAADAHFNLAGLFEKVGEPAAAIRHLKDYRKLTLGR
jgi:tetratricopeptide (TPR) repeat protein